MNSSSLNHSNSFDNSSNLTDYANYNVSLISDPILNISAGNNTWD